MLTKEQLTEMADDLARDVEELQAKYIAAPILAALERVQRETAEECAGLTRTPEAIEVAFGLEPEQYDPAASDLEEPRG